jgi:hypothetical protein
VRGNNLSSKSTDALSKGIDTSTKNPLLFVPALAPIVVHLLFLVLAYVVFPYRYRFFTYVSDVIAPNPLLVWGGYFIAAILGFMASCMVVDMANDSINGQPVDLNKSLNVVMGRLGSLILAAIIAAVCFITFFLIPVAMFILTIAIIEKTDAIESTKRAIDFVLKNLGEVIVFIIIVVIAWIVLSVGFALIPFIGAYLGSVISWLLNVVLTVASVHFYLSLKPAPPPPSPPQDSKSTA